MSPNVAPFSPAVLRSPPTRPDALRWTDTAVKTVPVLAPVPAARPAEALGESLEFRQLRHHSKNALQRLLCEVSKVAETETDWKNRRLLADLSNRLLLSAKVSDALFGFTAHPGPLDQRLASLAEATIELLGESTQSIRVRVSIEGAVRETQAQPLLRIAHEMVGNAVKHGLRARLVGRIEIQVTAEKTGTTLLVRDDGWGPGRHDEEGGGIAMMRELAGEGGDISLTRDGDWTIAAAELPGAPAPSIRRSLGLMAIWPLLVALPAAAIVTSWCCGVL